MHVNEGTLQAYLDGELSAEESSAVRQHIAGCGACAADVDGLRAMAGELTFALRLLDRPLSVADARLGVSRRTAAAPRVARELTFEAPFGRSAVRMPRSFARAAILVIGLAAAASAAVPGSPVRQWLTSTWERAAALFRDEPARVEAPVPAPAENPRRSAPPAGVAIRPVDGRVHILVTDAGPDAILRVRLVEAQHAATYATGGTPRFQTGPGRLEVIGGAPREIRVELPRQVPHATVTVDGRLYVVKEGSAMRLLQPAADSSATEVLFRLGS